MGEAIMVKAGWSTPMLHVQAVEKSIEFYRLLGFDLVDVEGKEQLGWARMQCERGAVSSDPDENIVLVEHCSDVEHTKWLAQLKEKKISP